MNETASLPTGLTEVSAGRFLLKSLMQSAKSPITTSSSMTINNSSMKHLRYVILQSSCKTDESGDSQHEQSAFFLLLFLWHEGVWQGTYLTFGFTNTSFYESDCVCVRGCVCVGGCVCVLWWTGDPGVHASDPVVAGIDSSIWLDGWMDEKPSIRTSVCSFGCKWQVGGWTAAGIF